MAFEIIYTELGLEKLVSAENGTPLVFEKFAVGDGENSPNPEQTALQNEKWRGFINEAKPSSTTPTNLLVTCVVPAQIPETEPFYIRELGLFDTEENLIAIAKVPDSYYAQSNSGIASEKLYNIVLTISNTAEVTLQLDSAIYATEIEVKELNDTILATQASVEELTDQFQIAQASLVQLNNNFAKSLKIQIGKIVINLNPLYKDKTLWNDGMFEYALCNGQSINADAYPELATIYGTNVPNFKNATVRHIPVGDSRTLGAFQDFAIEKITGSFRSGCAGILSTANYQGAFTVTSRDTSSHRYNDSNNDDYDKTFEEVSFDASRVVRTSTETRMQNIAVQFYVIGRVLI